MFVNRNLISNLKDHDVVDNGGIGTAKELSELSTLPDETPSLCVSGML